MSIRIDKYAWCVRLTKTRSIATDLVQKGKIKLNSSQVKPSRDVKVGDTIQVIRNTAIFEYKIKDLLDRRIGAKLIADYLIDVTKPEEIEKYKTYAISQATYRNYGTGRPSKHDRQEINEFLLWENELEEDETT